MFTCNLSSLLDNFGGNMIKFELLSGMIYASKCYEKAKPEEPEKTEETPDIEQTKVKNVSGKVFTNGFLLHVLSTWFSSI